MKSVGFIGSGNVATQMALALHEKGLQIPFVQSAHLDHAQALANKVKALAVEELPDELYCDAIIVCVKDDKIEEATRDLRDFEGWLIHTSGSRSIDILPGETKRGVIYPFQSISKSRKTEWEQVPLYLESKEAQDNLELESLAVKIGHNLQFASSKSRRALHLSGVFANNFVNHLAGLTFDLLAENGLSKNDILPLIEETLEKIKSGNPDEMQTGPALRRDELTLEEHRELLSSNPDLLAIYNLLSESIQTKHKR